MADTQETAHEHARSSTWFKGAGLALVLGFSLIACSTPGGGDQEPEPEPAVAFADAAERFTELGAELAQIQTDLASPPVALAVLQQLFAAGFELPVPAPVAPMQVDDTSLLPRGQWEAQWVEDAESPGWWYQDFNRVGDLAGAGEFAMDFSIAEFEYTETGANLVAETPANLSVDWEHGGAATAILELDFDSIEVPRHVVADLVYGEAAEPLADLNLQLEPVVVDVSCESDVDSDAYRMISLTKLLASATLGTSGSDFFVDVTNTGFDLDQDAGRLGSTGDIAVQVADNQLGVDWVFEFTTEGDIDAILDITGCGDIPEAADSTVDLELNITINDFQLALDAAVSLDASANTADLTLIVGIDDLGTFEVAGTISLDGETENPFADLTVTFADEEYTFDEFVDELERLFEG